MKKVLGSPNSYEKNVNEGESSFARSYDLKIPLRETDQGRVALGKKTSNQDVGEMIVDDPIEQKSDQFDNSKTLQEAMASKTAPDIEYIPVSCLNTYV